MIKGEQQQKNTNKQVVNTYIVDIGLLVEKLACCEICANCDQKGFNFDSTLDLAYFYPFSVAIVGLPGVQLPIDPYIDGVTDDSL